MIHNAVGFVLTFHDGPLDGLTSKWCEQYDADTMRPRPTVLYAIENRGVLEVTRRQLSSWDRYAVEPGGRDLILDLRYAPVEVAPAQ